MNGSNGIQPTIELATTNGNGFYPVYPMMCGNGNNGSGFFGGDGIWALVLLALLFGNNGWGGGFGNGGNNDFAWLSNGQKDIMTNTNNGFDTLHLSNQLEGNRDALNSLSNQICNSTASINSNIANGFYTSEVAENNRQLSYLNSLNDINTSLLNCCCENRLGIANLNSTILAENCADREALSNGIRDIITNQTANTQRVLDQLCQDKIDAKNDTIAQLRQELLYARGQASQIEQTATLRRGQEAEVDALYNRLSSCPVPTVPVYGRQPIFTCNNNGCGCGANSIYGVNV